MGGRFGYRDQGQTPNTQWTAYDFGDIQLLCEQRGLIGRKGVKIGVEFHTDQGLVKERKFFPSGQKEGEPIAGAPVGGFADPGQRHFRNFIDCVRSRNREELNGEILAGHRSSLLAHLGNISYRLGAEVPFNRKPAAFAGDKLADDALEAMKGHLVNDAGVELAAAACRLGRELRFDAERERFSADAEANQMLTRPYRGPFGVPEQV